MQFPFFTRPFAVALAACLGAGLAGCVSSPSPRPVSPVALQPAAPGNDILWARKDGRRMSGDPVLFEQGTQDKQRCAEEASMSGALDFPLFASCMDQAGYKQMKRQG